MNKPISPLFSNYTFLEERPSDRDALEYLRERDHVKARLDRLVSMNKHSIIAYLGQFGVGKSTVLKEVKKITQEYRWVEFDMWRYSNRNELWDAFVIKLVADLTTGKDEFDIADEVEGASLNGWETIAIFIWVAGIWLGLTVLSLVLWASFKDGIGVGAQFWEAYLKYAVPTITPILILVGLGRFLQLSFITSKRPLKRIFELESKLFNKLKRMKKPLIVVVEDADRSGEDGRIFLETLNNFLGLKAISKIKPIIILAPQSLGAFNRDKDISSGGIESSLKIYDEKIYFNSTLSSEAVQSFFTHLEVKSEYRDQLTHAAQQIVEKHKRSITIRLLKHALREVDQFVGMNASANPIIALSIILSRYVDVYTSTGDRQMALRMLESGREHGSENAKEFFQSILIAIDDTNQVVPTNARYTLKFSDEERVSMVQHKNGTYRYDIEIPTFYINLIN